MPARGDVDRIGEAQGRLAARSESAAAVEPEIWNAFAALAAAPGWAKDATRVSVLCNFVSLHLLGEAEDLLTLDSLVRSYGAERVAAIQSELDDLLGLGPDLPVTTGVIRRLADLDQIQDRLAGAGLSPPKVATTSKRVHHHAFWLLLSGAEDLPRTAIIRTGEHLFELLAHGNARRWRAALLPMIESPWGPYGDHVIGLLKGAGLDSVATMIDECRKVYQRRQEQRERDAIAREIRRLVAISGLTQRDFAAHIGTSPSRLSTYVNGRVVPSAAMLLRMRRVAHAQHPASS